MHAYVVLGGRYKAAATRMAGETWQTGLRFIVAPGGAPDAIGTLPDDESVYPSATSINLDETNWTIQGNWFFEMGVNDLVVADWLNDQLGPATVALFSTANLFSSSVYVETIKVYPIADDGHVAPAPPYAVGTPVTLTFKTETACDGVTSGGILPPQTSIVVSTRTNQFGPSARGRMFLPPPPVAYNAGAGVIASSSITALQAGLVTWFEACQVNGTLNGSWALPIVAGTNLIGAQRTYGPYALIKQFRIGDVFDTQRRRRRSISEVYSQSSFDNPA